MSDDPLRGSDLPPVPPTAPPVIPLTDIPPRHSPVDPIAKRNAATPATHASVAAVGQDVADLDGRVAALEGLDLEARVQRIGRDVLIVGLLTIIALAAVLVVGIFTFGNRHTLDQMRAMQATDNTRHTQIETVQHNAICTSLRTQAGTYSPTARVNDPAGTVHYDAPFVGNSSERRDAGLHAMKDRVFRLLTGITAVRAVAGLVILIAIVRLVSRHRRQSDLGMEHANGAGD